MGATRGGRGVALQGRERLIPYPAADKPVKNVYLNRFGAVQSADCQTICAGSSSAGSHKVGQGRDRTGCTGRRGGAAPGYEWRIQSSRTITKQPNAHWICDMNIYMTDLYFTLSAEAVDDLI